MLNTQHHHRFIFTFPNTNYSIQFTVKVCTFVGLTLTLTLTVFCDNEAVYKNVTFAESCLKKKHNSICFHRVRQCVAAGILAVHKVDTKFNLSDILTKSLPGPLRKFVRERIMFIPN